MQSYIYWALLGMVGYSLTTLFTKLAEQSGGGVSSYMVLAVSSIIVAIFAIAIVGFRGELKPLMYDLERGTLAWAIAGGIALAVAVSSLFHALSLGPANVVVPIYGMLEERLGAIGNPRYRGYVEDIHQSGLYALSLLNDLLDISKIDAGKIDLDFTAVDLPELVEACVNSLQPLAKRERILLRTSLAPNLPAVIADRRRLKQILLNLLSNAIKFTNAGGQVIVSARVIDGGDLRLRVHDTGVGMTEDELAAAMQPFHQLDTAPRKQAGTGLGLPVTKALVEANRARLVIASDRGAGTSADVIFAKDRLAAP